MAKKRDILKEAKGELMDEKIESIKSKIKQRLKLLEKIEIDKKKINNEIKLLIDGKEIFEGGRIMDARDFNVFGGTGIKW